MSESQSGQLIGELLLAREQIRQDDLNAALRFQAEQGGRLGAVLMRMGAVTAERLYAALSDQLGMGWLRADEFDEAALRQGLQDLESCATQLLRLGVLPWRDEAGWQLACADPLEAEVREFAQLTNELSSARWWLVAPDDAQRWVQRLGQSDLSMQALDERALRELAEDAPVIAWVNNLIAQAVESRASDIHLEPGEREFEVRLRIDGQLHTRLTLGMDRYPAVASRIKLIAGIDIAERRLPQDGRISTRAAGAEMDVRVSSIPAVFGESIVMRLLPKRRSDLSLERLGLRPQQLRQFRRWLGLANGLVLVTGPTGAGKSTTLYSALAATNDQSRKILTVEDPVEFRLPNVIQVQAQPDIGYTFARALRAFLRHDPDIIMVGEIRDRETAEIAIQSALTGHLVLATLHTNDAPSAVTRLVDMGVEPFLVGASLRAVMAQRLVRRLCDRCAQPADTVPALSEDELALALNDLRSEDGEAQPPRWRHPVGCPECQQTGFRGRVGIYEMLEIDAEMQHALARDAGLPALIEMAAQRGYRTLAQEGGLKVAQGITTLDEVLRATGGAGEA
ncbi:ATPase, T2SS/T4P/T4SS family [Roseateles asaccharophilus]|uniref:General secretion pathway protein E n=1 Tax=Roseateles asaccharophilus TaxID=582607 RepID=A0ABU2ABY3_9BURK|nr:ATPase, T2SS/T4P/T4SS family [Roseateles asaccharophilus]MDR7334717.1 general secretion pathway protein E [Roseateles asaccharophilus]